MATYNEAENLPSLVQELESLNEDLERALPSSVLEGLSRDELRIFVVDDNSPDGTSEVAQELAQRYGNLTVITRPRLLGLGSALRTGIREALAAGCQYIMTMDGDLSHDPHDVARLLVMAQEGGAAMVQASRYVKGGGTVGWGLRRRLQSRGANLLYHWLLGTPHEVTTNFRVFDRRLGELVVNEARGKGFEFQPECILIAMRHGLPIAEVPIVFTERTRGKSKLRFAQTVGYILFFLTSLVTFRLRVGRFARTVTKDISDLHST